MGVLSASTCLSRYEVIGEYPEEGFWEWFNERLMKYAFREIEEEPIEQSIGWVSIENGYDSEFAYQSYNKGEYAIFSMRIDKRTIPSALLKKYVELAFCKRLKESNRNYLVAAEKRDIKAAVNGMLLCKMLPVPSIYDVCWRMSDNLVWLTSLSSRVQDNMVELFKRSFDLQLRPLIPYVLATRILNNDMAVQELSDLVPTVFNMPGGK